MRVEIEDSWDWVYKVGDDGEVAHGGAGELGGVLTLRGVQGRWSAAEMLRYWHTGAESLVGLCTGGHWRQSKTKLAEALEDTYTLE